MKVPRTVETVTVTPSGTIYARADDGAVFLLTPQGWDALPPLPDRDVPDSPTVAALRMTYGDSAPQYAHAWDGIK